MGPTSTYTGNDLIDARVLATAIPQQRRQVEERLGHNGGAIAAQQLGPQLEDVGPGAAQLDDLLQAHTAVHQQPPAADAAHCAVWP